MAKADVSTRLRQAIILNDIPLIQRLLQNHPTLLQNPDYKDKSNTSLHLAAQYGHEEVAEYLISLGHDCSAESNEFFYRPAVDNQGISVNTDGHCPLHVAAMNSRSAVVELLCIQFPQTINRIDKQGRTPLHLASSAQGTPKSTTLDTLLIKNATRSVEDISTVDTLIAHGANVNAQDKLGNTCLHNASAWGNLKAVRALIQAGADPLCSNYAGWTPEYYSITVQAEVYYRNLVAEWEKRKAEESIRASERRAKGGGAVRLVSNVEDNDDAESEKGRSRASSGKSQATTTTTTSAGTDSDSGLGINVGRIDTWM